MNRVAARDYWDRTAGIWLLAALLGGPLVWGLYLQTSYAFVKWVCTPDRAYLLAVFAAVALLGTAACAVIGAVYLVQSSTAREEGSRPIDRSFFLAAMALGLNALLVLLVLNSLIPQFVLTPCE